MQTIRMLTPNESPLVFDLPRNFRRLMLINVNSRALA